MSVVRRSSYSTFYGLSTDTKPTTSSVNFAGPIAGDRFIETDTGTVYLYNGSAWTKPTTVPTVVAGM